MTNTQAHTNSFTTLSQVVDYYQHKGYNHVFNLDNRKENPVEWCITGYYRFEGNTNPEDSSIIYILHKLDNSAKGILVDAYGIYSSATISKFIKQVNNCNRESK